MKRCLSLLCAALLAFSALPSHAESLRARVNAPMHVESVSQSPSGRTHVTADAEVIVPEVDAVPIYEVFPCPVDEMTVRQMLDALFSPGMYTLEEGVSAPDTPAGFTYQESLSPGYRDHALFFACKDPICYDIPTDDILMWADYFTYETIPDYYLSNLLNYYANAADNTGRSIPPEAEARRMADTLIHQIFPNFSYHSREKTLNENCQISLRAGHSSGRDDYGYRFYYCRTLDGIPVSCVSDQGARDDDAWKKGRTNFALPYEKLFVDVGEHGVYQIMYEDPISIGGVLQEDCALLPFADILRIFEEIAPLSIASSESNANNALIVEKIVLGYMCVPMRDAPHRYRMIPVWDFYGTRTIGRERYSWVNYSLFTLNAIDGTVIDREYGY